MTGTHLIEEAGVLVGPLMLTNTISLGTVRRASIRWQLQIAQGERGYVPNPIPVVAETWDGVLNDIMGDHITEPDVFSALNGAASGALAEGNVGGGTGTTCFGYKCGTGTSSRIVDGGFTVGAIVQANHGARRRLIIAGVPVGLALTKSGDPASREGPKNSVIVVFATDAPLLPHQLKALAKRATVGIGRTGGIGEFYSGDLFLAFSTANPDLRLDRASIQVRTTTDARLLDALYDAAAQATEEGIINAMVAAETMAGYDGHRSDAIPHDKLQEILRLHSRPSR
jgi:L-aminopeptidase/D-esterase-like protein